MIEIYKTVFFAVASILLVFLTIFVRGDDPEDNNILESFLEHLVFSVVFAILWPLWTALLIFSVLHTPYYWLKTKNRN